MRKFEKFLWSVWIIALVGFALIGTGLFTEQATGGIITTKTVPSKPSIEVTPINASMFVIDGFAVDYNATRINEEVVAEINNIFYNVSGFTDWASHLVNDGESCCAYGWFNGKNEIGIEINSIKDSKVYKAVFAHEYTHYILYNLGYNDFDKYYEFQEGFAEAVALYLARDGFEEIRGKDGSGTHYPYTMITQPILENGDYDCLQRVFISNSTINDIVNRLATYCNVNVSSLV